MVGIFKDNTPKPVIDTFTGNTYPSKTQTGKALASGFALDETDNLVWYQNTIKNSSERSMNCCGF